MEMQHKEGSSPPLPRSQRGKENTPHSGRKSSAASKPPSARQPQKGKTSQSLLREAVDTTISERTDGRKFKGEHSPTPSSTPKSTRKGRQGADDTTKNAHTGETQIDGGIHPLIHTSATVKDRGQARGAKSKHCVPLSLIGSEETADQEPEVLPRLQRQRKETRSKGSSNSTSTSLDKRPSEEDEKSSTPQRHEQIAGERQKVSSGESMSSLSTSTSLEEMADEEQEDSSAPKLNRKSEARSKLCSPGTSIIQKEIRGSEQEASSASTSILKRPSARARGKISSPLTSKSEEEAAAGNNHEVSTVSTSTLKKQGTQRRPKLSTHSTSTSLKEIACEKHEVSSLPKSTQKRQAKGKHPSSISQSLEKTAEDYEYQSLSASMSTLQKEEETQVSLTTLKKKGTGARSKLSSNSTSTSLEKISSEDHESFSQLTSTKIKRREAGARGRLSSPPTATNQEDIAGEEDEVSSASKSTLKKRGTRGKYNLSSPLTTESPDQMSDEELDASSELTSPLNSAAEARGKSSPPTSTVHYQTAGKKHEVSPSSASALKTGSEVNNTRFSSVTSINKEEMLWEEHQVSFSSTSTLKKAKGKSSSPLISKNAEETVDRGLQSPSGCMPTLQEKDEGDERKLSSTTKSKIVKQGGAPERMSSVPAAKRREETERLCETSLSTPTELKAYKETEAVSRKPKTPRRKINDSGEMKLIREAEEVMRKAHIEVSANPTRNGNDFFDEEVKLEKKEKLQASFEWNRLRQNILESLNEGSAWTWDALNSGSSYDGTKVARADEVDCMFIPKDILDDWMEIEINGAPPEFCFINLRDLSISDSEYLALKELCGDQGMIKSALFRNKVFHLFTKGIANNRHAKAGQPSATGAAFPVDYCVLPKENPGLLPISLDLVPALHFTKWPNIMKSFLSKLPDKKREAVEKVGFHAVPKQCLDGSVSPDCLWRLSFSAAEKQMTNFVDGKDRDSSSAVVTTYRKHVMRMVKRILEICKGIDNSKRKRPCPSVQELNKAVTTLREQRNVEIKCFSTFQIRTLFWDDFYVRLPADEDWERTKWRTRLQETFRNLRKMLTGEKQVQHFFVPALDTMESVPIEEREFLYIIFYIAEKIF